MDAIKQTDMKTILRNFFSVLRRFSLAAFLNVAGLAVAFATFIIIMIQISFERNFDRCHPTADRIYRVELSGEVVEAEAGTFFPYPSARIDRGCYRIISPYRGW